MSAILVLQNNETAAMLVFPSQFCKSWTFLYMSRFLRRDIYQGEGLDLPLGMIKF